MPKLNWDDIATMGQCYTTLCKGAEAPKQHIDAIRLVFNKQIKGSGGEVRSALLKDIERAVKKFSEPRGGTARR